MADDVLAYENDGIDWLVVAPDGRAVFLATDGKAERVMRQADGRGRRGPRPAARRQPRRAPPIVSAASMGRLGGWLTAPTPSHALTTSRASVTVGLPARVHPVAVLGGDRPWLAYGAWDAAAIAASIGIALLALRGRLPRTLGAVALGGLWLAAPVAWEALVGTGVLAGAAWAAARVLPRNARVVAWALLGLVAFVGGIGTMSMKRGPSTVSAASTVDYRESVADESTVAMDGERKMGSKYDRDAIDSKDAHEERAREGEDRGRTSPRPRAPREATGGATCSARRTAASQSTASPRASRPSPSRSRRTSAASSSRASSSRATVRSR